MQCLTDNRNRARGRCRLNAFKEWRIVAENGSVSFNFERKGQIVVPSEGVDFDSLFDMAAEAGAEDVENNGDTYIAHNRAVGCGQQSARCCRSQVLIMILLKQHLCR